jgi:replicative DNA helicase
MIELLLLNALISTRDYHALQRHALNSPTHFQEQRAAYDFIIEHLEKYGELPSLESVIAACDDFEAMEVTESIDTLCLKLAERNLKLEQKDTLKKLAMSFGDKDAYELQDEFKKQIERLDKKASARTKNGSNWAVNGADREAEYKRRQSQDFNVKIPFFFDEFTEATGGAERGDVCVTMASTGHGKSWLGLLQSLVAHNAGFKVLVESGEMSKPENEFRLDTLDAGFSNRGLWTGELDNEAEYVEYLKQFSKGNGKADLIIKTAQDWPKGLTLQQIQYDAEQSKADVIVIDQFSLLQFKSGSKEDKTTFSRQLKQLAAKLGVVIFILYQTNGGYLKKIKEDDDGITELVLPTLDDYSETIALIQDGSFVFGWASVTWKDEASGRRRGKGIAGILKARSGGAGPDSECDVEFCPNDGIIRPRTATDIF